MYTPIIRNRQSESLALQLLDEATKEMCIPLVDMAAPSKSADVAGAIKYVENNLRRMERILSGFEKAFVDSSELDPDFRLNGRHPLIDGAEAMVRAGVMPIPVTGIHRDVGHMNAALEIMSENDDKFICFRLDETDIKTATLSLKRISKLLLDNSISQTDVILLLDLQSVHGTDPTIQAQNVSRFIATALSLNSASWGGFIVAGYGVPDTISDVIQVRQQGYIPRVELHIFNAVIQQGHDALIWFGDYTTVTPTQVELDVRIIHKVMGPKIIYALDTDWFVIRGGPFQSHNDGYDQYYDLAREVIALPDFSGHAFSFGDNYVFDRSMNIPSAGSPASWIKACVNHHVALTALSHRGYQSI